MSSFLEFEGKNEEKAIEKACETLKIAKEDLKYEVISYGSSGIFGLVGTKKAKIRVTTLHSLDSKDSYKKQMKKDVSSLIRQTFGEEESGQLPVGSGQKESGQKESSQLPVGSGQKESDQKESGQKESGQLPVVSDHKPADQLFTDHYPDNPTPEQIQLTDDLLKLGKEALQQIVNLITIDATVSAEKGEDRLMFKIQGGNSAVLIGKRGQTLEAIQYLIEKIINKRAEDKTRIQVDVEGYLDKRRSRLENMAARLAEKVKRTGKPVTIGQLNAQDRRVIHIALKDDPSVKTQSMGDGFYRKLVIFPKKK